MSETEPVYDFGDISARDVFLSTKNVIENIIRDAEHKTKKSIEIVSFDKYEYPEKTKVCQNFVYNIGKKMKEHESSVNISCCGDECILDADIVIKSDDTQIEKEIDSIFSLETCSTTTKHLHNDEKHIHILCKEHPTEIRTKIMKVHSMLI